MPVSSEIWARIWSLARGTPRAFHPKPVRNQPRIHSRAHHAEAPPEISRRFFGPDWKEALLWKSSVTNQADQRPWKRPR